MLESQKLVAFIPVIDADRARAFYRGTLGLRLVHEDGFALVFDVEGVMLRATLMRGFKPQPFTVLGWNVADAVAVADTLAGGGVALERFPGLEQDEHGLWHAPGGALVGWFKDPDGNILSISQHS
ncbi:MAG TPA: VOC family protein [Acidobacteriaceae bacterium]|nr:VOC family protein [Acidobacteriaceae bacterium]